MAKESEVTFFASTDENVLSSELQRIEWFLNSGATYHMINNKDLFEELCELNQEVKISVTKSGHCIVAKHAGTVWVDMLVKETKRPAVITNVSYVPGVNQDFGNLFSVRRLEEKGLTVKISGGKVLVSNAKEIVCAGERQGKLYALDIFRRMSAVNSCAMTTKLDSPYDLWHRRFVHLGGENLQ